MTKRSFVIIFLISFFLSSIKSNKIPSKILRKLTATVVTYSSWSNYLYDVSTSKLKFDVNLGDSDSLSSLPNSDNKLTIIFKENQELASCSYASQKLSCEFSPGAPFYSSIQLSKEVNADATIDLNLNNDITLEQTTQIGIRYTNANFYYLGGTQNSKWNLQIYVSDELPNGASYKLGVKVEDAIKKADCVFNGQYLDCTVLGDDHDLITFVKEPTVGSIKWSNDDESELQKNILLQLNVKNIIYGFDLDYKNNNWEFKIHAHNLNVVRQGYYYTINILLKKRSDGSFVKARAKCLISSEVYTHQCKVENIIDPVGGTQALDDLVYVSTDQTDATISFEDGVINENKIMIRSITLKFEEIYDFKFDNNKWVFKIKVEAEGEAANIVRDGLNVTVALYRESEGYRTASCIFENNILSCEKDDSSQYYDELLYFVFQKSVGSVTWSNKQSAEKTKIPLEIELTHVLSYYLAYKDSKWTFKMTVKPTTVGLPANSLIKVDLLYDTNKYTTAECDENGSVAQGVETTFTCHCTSLDSSKTFQISKTKNEGSVTWKGLSNPVSIDKRNDFKFIRAYNLELNYVSTAKHPWLFEIQFEDIENIHPTTSDVYSIDISYTESADTKKDGRAECSLKEDTSNIFSCNCNIFTNDAVKNVVLYIRPTKTTTSKYIQWTQGIDDYFQIPFKTEFTFVKGILSYNTKWFLNINIQDPKDNLLIKKSLVIIDITKDSVAQTIDCYAKSSSLLECDTGITSDSLSTLPAFYIKKDKSDFSSAKFLNSQTDEKFYCIYLETQLTFSSAQNMIFNGDSKWQFDLYTSETLKNNIGFIIDAIYDSVATTATCIKGETAISCIVNQDNQGKNQLVKISKSKPTNSISTITWKNLSEDKNIFISKELKVDSVDSLLYEGNKWKFKIHLENSDLPLNSVVKIDIEYKSSPSTATCTHTENNLLLCIPDVASQGPSDGFSISSEKNQGTVSYSGDVDIDNLTILKSNVLSFDSASSLTLKNNYWEFIIKLKDMTLENQEATSIEIDIEYNGIIEKVQCTINNANKELACKISKKESAGKIILIKNDQNLNLSWLNLKKNEELYVAYDIKYINCYGGFSENIWKFNLNYQHTANTIEANNYYTSLDITIDNQKTLAECKITEKLLLCESKHEEQNNEQALKLYGAKESGAVSISDLLDTQKVILPLNINLEQAKITDFDSSNDEIIFKINGQLKNLEAEIAENIITEIEIIVTKKTGTKDQLNTVCITDEFNDNNIILICKVNENMNEEEDDVDIKVGSDGKSKYITFVSISKNINVFKHVGETPEETRPDGEETIPEETKTTPDDNSKNPKDKGNNGFMMKINYFLIFAVYLLF